MRKLFLYFIIFTIFNSCQDNKIKPRVDESIGSDEIPIQESWNSEIIFTDEGLLKAVLYTDHLQMFEDKKITLLENVKIDFYDENRNITSTLTSKRGRVDDISKDMYAIDSVVAVSDSGVTLITDELIWRSKKQKIASDKFVRIISQTEIIEGYGFESDQHLNNYVIYDITYTADVVEEKKSE
jgi:LPS export ABC transporter protein LptC